MNDNSPSLPSPARMPRSDLPETVAAYLRSLILKGDMQPGDQLPTERELGEVHAVSRVVVREAIARLRHEGLVVSRQGKGVFVVSPDDAKFLSISDGALDRPEDYRQLYEVRKILESGTAALAATYYESEDLEAMRTALERMSASDLSSETYVDADIAFHRSIATASKNTFLALFISFVDAKLKDSIALALSQLDFAETIRISAQEHRAIFKSIKLRKPDAARLAMLRHLENSSSRLGL